MFLITNLASLTVSSCKIPTNIDPTFPVITGAALVDSINPCAITVLLILIAALMISADKKKVLWTGLVFSLGLFVAYFVLGLGLATFFKLFALAKIFHIIVGIFAILVGIYSLKNAYNPPKDNVCVGGVCASDSRSAQILAKVTSLPAAFFAGVIITLIELPCTGGPYLFALGCLSKLPKFQMILYLIYYNFIFILPLLVITLLIFGGFASIEKTSKWKKKNYKMLNLITGIIMIALGIWVILS